MGLPARIKDAKHSAEPKGLLHIMHPVVGVSEDICDLDRFLFENRATADAATPSLVRYAPQNHFPVLRLAAVSCVDLVFRTRLAVHGGYVCTTKPCRLLGQCIEYVLEIVC